MDKAPTDQGWHSTLTKELLLLARLNTIEAVLCKVSPEAKELLSKQFIEEVREICVLK
jgi:hypothetical protein